MSVVSRFGAETLLTKPTGWAVRNCRGGQRAQYLREPCPGTAQPGLSVSNLANLHQRAADREMGAPIYSWCVFRGSSVGRAAAC